MAATQDQIIALQRALQAFSARYKLGQHIPVTGKYDATTDRSSKWSQWLLGFGQDQIGHWPLEQVVSWLNHPSVYFASHPGGLVRHRQRLAQVRSGGDAGKRISAKGTAFIAGFEGYSANWYDDGTGVRTVGVGHTGPLPRGFVVPLSRGEQERLLAHDMGSYEQALDRVVHRPLTQPQRDALLSVIYNLGPGVLTDSYDLAGHINRGDWGYVCAKLPEYSNPGSNVHEGLLRRRHAEVRLIQTGRY